MGTTTRYSLPYPELTDAPNGPAATKALADATEGWLGRAVPCLSTMRPSAPPTGLVIRESDTGAVLIWTGSIWDQINLASAGPTNAEAQFSASSTQSLVTTGLRVIAFGTEDTASPHVTRNTRGTGHDFTLALTGRWSVTSMVRYAYNSASGERFAGLYNATAPTVPLDGNGCGGPEAVTCKIGLVRRFVAGTVLFVAGWQDTGGSRQLEPATSNVGNVRINLTYVGP